MICDRDRAPRPTTWWGHCVGYPGTRRPRGVQALDRDHQVDTNLFAVGVSRRDAWPRCARASRCATARRLRRRRAGPRRRRAAGALPGHVREGGALMQRRRQPVIDLPFKRPGNLPRRRSEAADIDLADIQGNVLRGYTFPTAAYIFLRIDDVERARALMSAHADRGGDRRALAGRPAGDRHPRRLHLLRACRRSACPTTSSPPSRPSSARAWPPAPSASATAGRARPRTGSPAWAPARRTCSSPSTRSTTSTSTSAARCCASSARRHGATTVINETRAEALPGGKDHFGFFDGIAQPAVAGSGVERASGRRPARRRRRLARRLHRRVPARPRRRGRRPARRAGRAVRPQRDVRGLPQAADRRRGLPRATSRSKGARLPGRPRHARGQDRRALERRDAARALPRRARPRRSSTTRRGSTTSPTPTTPRGCAARSAPHIRRANPRDAEGFFDGRMTNRHRIIRRGRTYGHAAARGRHGGRRRRSAASCSSCFNAEHLAPVRDDPDAVDRRRRPVRPRSRQGLPHRRARRQTAR